MIVRDQLDQPWDHARTVDPAEVARFTALAEEWWNPGGKFRLIHTFNRVRRDYITERVATHFGRQPGDEVPLAGLDVLDVGCGAGVLCEPLAEHGARIVGIDASSRNIEIARWHAAQRNVAVDYRHCLAGHVVETAQTYDVVLNTEVIEHVADPAQLLKECAALVRPGGVMVVATLNRTLRAFVLAIVGAEYVLGWLPRGTHDWRKFLRPDEIEAMITPHGMEVRERIGVAYNPISRIWRRARDTGVNYMVLATKPT